MRLFMSYSRIIKAASLVVLSSILFLFLLEGCLRIGGYLLSKKVDLREAQSEDFNIICLGDSFTYGISTESIYAYPAQLERMLNGAHLSRNFKVFNLGVPGSNSSQQLRYLKSIFSKYKNINLVIVLTGANDNWNFADSNIYELTKKGNRRNGSATINLEAVLLKTRLYKMLKIVALHLQGKSPELNLFNRTRENRDFGRETVISLLAYNLKGMVEAAQANNAGIILQNYPHARSESFKDISVKLGVPLVDNYANFQERLNEVKKKDLFIFDNAHPNANGYRIMAEAIFKVITGQILNVKTTPHPHEGS